MAATIQTIETPKRWRAQDTSSSLQPVGPNLIVNGSFGASGSGLGTGWTSGNNANDTEAISTGNGFPGNAQKLTSGGDGSGGVANSFVYQIISSLENNTVYEFSYYQRSTQGMAGYIIEVEENDVHYTVNHAANTGNAIKHTKQFTTGDSVGNVYIRFYVRTTTIDAVSGDVMEFSEVTLRKCESLGNNNHGQIYSGRGLEFDGVSDYLTTGYGSGLNPYTSPITVSAWVKASSSGNIFFGPTNGSGQRFYIGVYDTKFDLGLYDSAWGNSPASGALPRIDFDTWYRVTVVLNSGVGTFYVNGESQFTKNYSSYAFNSDFYIGWHGMSATPQYRWDGHMSDLQVWDAAWTADDVAFDYANPEQLALNRGGTSLTESNLKLWYPMNDGHRGQQSYVLDASNTGLGDALFSDDFTSDITGWDVASGGGDDPSATLTNPNGYLRCTKTADSDWRSSFARYADFSATDGTVLKITFNARHSVGTDDFYCRTRYDISTTTNQVMLRDPLGTEWESFTFYNTAKDVQDISFGDLAWDDAGTGQWFEIDNVIIKPINDKNHATTVFYGDELWDGADNSPTNWTDYVGSDTVASAECLKMIPGSNAAGSRIFFQDDDDLTTDLTVGRKYRLTCKVAADIDINSDKNKSSLGIKTDAGWNWPTEGATISATNLINNPGFETAGSIWANWTENAGSGALANETSIVHNGDDSAKLTSGSGGERSYIAQSFTTVVGTNYLVTAWLRGDGSSGSSVRYTVEQDSVGGTDIVAETDPDVDGTTWTQIAFQFTAGTTTSVLTLLSSSGSSLSGYVDDVVVTAFLDKTIDFTADHATTNYLSHQDAQSAYEYIDAEDSKNSLFTGTPDWEELNIASSSVSVVGGKLQVVTTTDNEPEGAQLPVAHFTDLEVGRSYVVSASLDAASGAPTIKVDLGGSSAATATIDTDEDVYTFHVTPVNTTGALRVYTEVGTAFTFTIENITLRATENAWIDEISFKEIGTATGWTDADQQLDIPQTALQSYNQLAWFSGQNGNYAALDSDIDTLSNSWSFSFWIFNKDSGQNYDFIIGKNTSLNLTLDNNSDRKLYYRDADGDYNALSDEVIPQGEWVHIVVTATGDTSMRAYINGEAQTSITSMQDSGAADTQLIVNRFMAGYSTSELESLGCITEISYYNDVLTQAEVNDLYNDGKAKDADEASGNGNLVGYWRNNGLAEWKDRKGSNDINTNNVTETILQQAGVDASRDCQGFLMNRQKDTNALNLPDNGNSYASVPSSSDLNFGDGSNDSEFSVSAWIKTSDLSSFTVISKSSTSNREWVFAFTSGDELSLYLYDESVSKYESMKSDSGFASTDQNSWIHVAATYDGTGGTGANGGIKLYRNGAALGMTEVSTATYTAMEALKGNVNVGLWDALSNYSEGEIDDVMIYSKELSAPEVKRNYNAGKRSHR